ncbi:MAG: PHP domain-containing protein [Oscillibacter sp.]
MSTYLYDPHCHTSETSKCGHLPAVDVVNRYVRNGFSGIVITDHLHPEYLSRIDSTHNWDAVMDHYLSGYQAAKAQGERVGLDVILGAELRFPENDRDYLVYGIDEAWLRSNPYMCCTSAREFYAKFHNDVLIIHAHPYRDGGTEVFEDAVHGSEIINGNARHDNYNELALAMCRRHPEFYRLAGSDTHQDGDEARAGIVLPRRVGDSFAYKEMIETHQFHLWSPEYQSFVDADEEIRRQAV